MKKICKEKSEAASSRSQELYVTLAAPCHAGRRKGWNNWDKKGKREKELRKMVSNKKRGRGNKWANSFRFSLF